METNEKKLTKKDITRSYIQWRLLAEVSHSYERYQSLSMAVTLSKPLRKLYTDDEEYRQALVRHMQFFNTEATIGAIIPGIVLSLEEDRANGAEIPDEVIASIKTGLMGPMAGIGDTLYWGTIKAICFSLAATMALSGNYAGMVFAFQSVDLQSVTSCGIWAIVSVEQVFQKSYRAVLSIKSFRPAVSLVL